VKVAIGPSSFAAKDDAPTRLLAERGLEVVPNPFGRRLTEDEIKEHLKGIDGLIAGLEPLHAGVLAEAPQLKAIARVGIGMDNVDLDAAAGRGIKVSNTPDAPAEAVAELTMTAMLALCRGLVEANTELHERRWTKKIGLGLRGLDVLFVGYGRIGRRVGAMLEPFGANRLVADPFLDDAGDGAELVELADGLARADVVTLHAAGADTLLGPAEFERMKDGVFLLNSARGGLVDQDALRAALDSGRVAGAWFDAHVEEPYDGPFCDYPQVLLTPHTGTYTLQCRRSMELQAVENLCRDLGR